MGASQIPKVKQSLMHGGVCTGAQTPTRCVRSEIEIETAVQNLFHSTHEFHLHQQNPQ